MVLEAIDGLRSCGGFGTERHTTIYCDIVHLTREAEKSEMRPVSTRPLYTSPQPHLPVLLVTKC